MSEQVIFRGVYPIGETDTDALPVRAIGPAVGYYTQVLGFALVSKNPDSAVLERDGVRIGLAVNGRDPEQASCYFAVEGLEALRRELDGRGIEPGAFGTHAEAGKPPRRIFFAQEPYGVCFCFGEAATRG